MREHKEDVNTRMELQELWRVIRKRLKMIILITVVAVATSGILSKFVLPKQYAGTATLIVIPHNSTQSLLTSMVTGQQLVDTYAQLVDSRAVVGGVIQSLGLNVTVTHLTKMITATPLTNTDLLTVTVKAPSPSFAARVANEVALKTVAEVTLVQGQKNLEVVNPAINSPIPVGPKTKINVAIALVLGLMVSAGLAFLLEYLDDSVRSEEDVKRVFDLPLLTVIPSIGDESTVKGAKDRPKRATRSKARGQRTVRSNGRYEGRL